MLYGEDSSRAKDAARDDQRRREENRWLNVPASATRGAPPPRNDLTDRAAARGRSAERSAPRVAAPRNQAREAGLRQPADVAPETLDRRRRATPC